MELRKEDRKVEGRSKECGHESLRTDYFCGSLFVNLLLIRRSVFQFFPLWFVVGENSLLHECLRLASRGQYVPFLCRVKHA